MRTEKARKSRSKRLFWSGILLAVLLCIGAAAGGLCLRGTSANAADAVVEIQSTYMRGQTLTVPQDAAISVGGTSYKANTAYLVYPGGNAYRGWTFELNECGLYKIVLENNEGDKILSASKTFSVTDDLYVVGNSSSSAEYKRLNSWWAEKYGEGLSVQLAEDDTLTYNRPVNIYRSAKINLISFNVLQADYDANVGKVNIRLTDVYDPSVYMDITYINDAFSQGSYLRASALGGSSVGINDKGNGNAVVVPGVEGNLTKDPNGTSLLRNYKDLDPSKEPHWHNITVALDTASHTAVRVWAVQDHEHNITSAGTRSMIVAEFNNPDLFPYTFGGFTTGEVWVSVTASAFANGTTLAPIEIAEIGDLYGAELEPAQYEDEIGPTIAFDVPQTGINIYAGTPVAVPSATVYDASGVKNNRADVVVWYSKNSSNKEMVSIESDGTFLPKRLGEYTLSYTAYDNCGNKTEKDIVLTATDFAREGQLGIGLTYPQIGGVKAGDILSFAPGDMHATSLNAAAEVVVQITDPDGVTSIVTSTYIAEKDGEYTVEYICTDVIYRCVYTQTFIAEASGAYSFTQSKIPTPNYMIKGADYSLENIELFQYVTGGRVAAEYDAYMISDGGTPVPVDIDKVKITASSTVQFRYVAKNDESKKIESRVIPVIDVEYSKIPKAEKYFVSEGFTKSVSSSDVTFKSDSGNGKIEFINPLLVSFFSVEFVLPATVANGSVTFILTDYYDHAKSISATLGNDGDGAYYRINGGPRTSFPVGTLLGNSTTLSFEEEAGEAYFKVQNSTGSFRAKSGLKLPSDNCLFEMELANAATFRLSAISSQVFSTSTAILSRFDADPHLALKSAEAVAEIGDLYKTPVAIYGDVLSPVVNSNCKLTIYYNNKIYTAADGTRYENVRGDVSYTLLLDKYGDYAFDYTFTDGRGNTSRIRPSHIVSVIDRIAPEISLKSEPNGPIDVRVGEKIKPRDYTASDNVTASKDLIVSVIVYDANGMLVTASRIEGNKDGSFTLKKAGLYTVYLYCMDEMGNVAYVTYTVNAK